MNLRSLIGTLGMAAIVASTAAGASAQTPYNYNPYNPNAQYNYRERSLVNVARMANGVGHLIGRLQRDARDYGGHREAAIDDLRNAQNELGAAAAFAEAHGYQMPVPVQNPGMRRAPNPYRYRNPQARSDWSIQKGQQAVQRWIGKLQRDSRDFGGHRVQAIDWLQRANGELGAAVQFAASRGY
jgi:hypothetical protein